MVTRLLAYKPVCMSDLATLCKINYIRKKHLLFLCGTVDIVSIITLSPP